MQELSGRVAVVTGAASGIGLALVRAFVAEGMSVVLSDLDTAELWRARDELVAAGADVHAVAADVSDAEAVDALALAAAERFGTYHLVCNNAGVPGHLGPSWETPLADWRWVLGVNVWGVVHGLRSFVPTLVAQGEGHVVNTASIAAWSAAAAMAPYAASKHAVLAVSEALHRELAAAGSPVGLSVLCPGGVATAFTRRTRWPDRLGAQPQVPQDALTAAMERTLARGTQAGASPEEVAQVVVAGVREGRFLLTTHPDWVLQAAQQRLAVAQGAPPELRRDAPPGEQP